MDPEELTHQSPELLRLAVAIASDDDVSWDTVEASATDPDELEMIRILKTISEISAVHRAKDWDDAV